MADYPTVVKEIKGLCENSSSASSAAALRYLQGKNADNFGGNLGARERFSYFDRENHGRVEIPCGFLKEFPISESG